VKFIQHVEGNVKGGCAVTLGRLTLLYGPNGAGKSRVVNTLELATGGEASDIVGRDKVRRGADLITLAPEDQPLKAKAQVSDGAECSFEIERNGVGKTRDPDHRSLPPSYSVIFPIRDAVAALRGQIGTARTFVLQHSGMDVSNEAVVSRFPELLRPLYATFTTAMQNGETPIEQLLLVRENAAKTARAAKAKAKQSEEIVAELNRQVAMVRPSEEDQKKMQDAVREANRLYQEAINIPDPPDLNQLRTNALDLIQKANEWQAEEKRVAEIANVPENKLVSLQASLHAILGVYVEAGGKGRCLICDGTVAAEPEVLQDRRKKIEGDAKLEAQRKAALAELSRVHESGVRAYNAAQQAIRLFQDAEKAAEAGGYTTSAADKQEQIRKAYAALTEAEKASKEMHQEVGRWDKVQEARQQSVVAKREAKEAEELSGECQKVADQLINAGRAGFVARVQKFLPPTDVFDLILQEGKREVCIFGFRRGTMIQSALSGAEWARLTIALAAAVLDAKPPAANTIAVLTPEERAFDSRTLAAVMRALVNAPGQVILTSPLAPKKEDQPALVESGWTILKISKKGDTAEGSAAGAD